MPDKASTINGHTIPITHPDKIYWPAHPQYTKLDVLSYYEQVGEVMLPYFRNRPVTIRFFPEGIQGTSYYVRDRQEHTPNWIKSISYHPGSEAKTSHLLIIDNLEDMIWFANKGGLEFHLWSTTSTHIDFPDMAIIDLDPGEGVPFTMVLDAALVVRKVLKRYDLESFPKTSGGKGLHVYIPIAPIYTYEQVHNFIKDTAKEAIQGYSDIITLPDNRQTHSGKRVTIDTGQNARGRNTASPYTIRLAWPSPTVSAPLFWEEVEKGKIVPTFFTPERVLERLRTYGDIFADTLTLPQKILDTRK